MGEDNGLAVDPYWGCIPTITTASSPTAAGCGGSFHPRRRGRRLPTSRPEPLRTCAFTVERGRMWRRGGRARGLVSVVVFRGRSCCAGCCMSMPSPARSVRRRARSVPMVVLAFLTDPDVVGRILRHLGLPACAPALAPARVASWEQPSGHLPPPVPCADVGVGRVEEGAGADSSCGGESGSADLSTSPPLIRPPP